MALALAWAARDRDRCSGCGIPRAIAWDQEASAHYEPRVFRCFTCLVREHVAAEFGKQGDTKGLHIGVAPARARNGVA